VSESDIPDRNRADFDRTSISNDVADNYVTYWYRQSWYRGFLAAFLFALLSAGFAWLAFRFEFRVFMVGAFISGLVAVIALIGAIGNLLRMVFGDRGVKVLAFGILGFLLVASAIGFVIAIAQS
jgi:hypothetical protein